MDEQVDYYECLDYDDIVTPIDVATLKQLLLDTKFDPDKTSKLIDGFENGFDIGYRGSESRRCVANNLPFIVGTPIDMWNKIMKEVKLGRYAGPFFEKDIPYKSFVQSPIGLVPKANDKTRLIFHLSFDFGPSKPSVNSCTPKDICSVKYNDLDHALKTCVKLLKDTSKDKNQLFFGETDLVSTFRILLIRPDQRKYLLLKAKDPMQDIWKFLLTSACHLDLRLVALTFSYFQMLWCIYSKPS